jgi:phage gp36-like protein
VAVYCARSDIENEFGPDNVAKWADVDNDSDPDKIENRVTWAIRKATAMLNAEFLGSVYSVPYATLADVPDMLLLLCATFSGMYLELSPRGLVDGGELNEQLTTIWDEAKETVQKLKAGILRLDAPRAGTSYPDAVPESEQ